MIPWWGWLIISCAGFTVLTWIAYVLFVVYVFTRWDK